MEARAWASDRSGALKAFARYEVRLAEELGAKPGADLVRMADLLRDGRRSSRPTVAGDPPERIDRRFEPETLIGREREFSVLYDAWLEARRKSPRIVVVTSDPGVGKTTLVNAFASTCQMDGAVVARAQAYDAERELPFAVLGELVKQLAAQRAIGSADPEALSELTRISSEILRVFPGVPKPVEWSPELTPLRIADAFLKTVTAAAAESPVMVVVDDIHAADNASTAILHSVARKLGDARVLVILTGRSSELRLSDAPWALTSDVSLKTLQALEMAPLSQDAAQRLVCRLATPNPQADPPMERILQASGGNPLAIELLTREWSEHGGRSLLRDLEALDTQPVPSIGIPRAIGTVFERQTRRLNPQLRAVLDLAAILGRRLSEVNLYSALELSSGQAAAALSRLRDDGYLREISGDLEFRNELIRAQAYYAVAGATRQHLHRRVADLLATSHLQDDKAINLEIAWHLLRGGDATRAIPFAIDGAEAVLAVGAPHGAEEILKAIIELEQPPADLKRARLLLARALLDQSRAEPAIPIIEELALDQALSNHEKAEVAMLRAAAEFLLNRAHGNRYSDVARIALSSAKDCGDPGLITQALFECARAGSEEGLSELIELAERGLDDLGESAGVDPIPMGVLTKAFCRFSLSDPRQALAHLQRIAQPTLHKPNSAQLAFIHSGMGIANYFLGHLDHAREACLKALDFAKKVGDDSRISQIGANLCTVEMSRGNYDDAIKFGEMSIRLGEASRSTTLLTSYTNLMDPYTLVGRHNDAMRCLDNARKWLGPERRWKLHCAFFVEAASFALIQHNNTLALDLISQLEVVARGRENAVPMPGSYWKLIAYKKVRLGHRNEAHEIIRWCSEKWRDSCPLHYLDILAARAWLERLEEGGICHDTATDLNLFETIGAVGRRALFVAQGFLSVSKERELLQDA